MDELENYTFTPIPTAQVILHEITAQLFTSTRIVGHIVVVVACCPCG